MIFLIEKQSPYYYNIYWPLSSFLVLEDQYDLLIEYINGKVIYSNNEIFNKIKNKDKLPKYFKFSPDELNYLDEYNVSFYKYLDDLFFFDQFKEIFILAINNGLNVTIGKNPAYKHFLINKFNHRNDFELITNLIKQLNKEHIEPIELSLISTLDYDKLSESQLNSIFNLIEYQKNENSNLNNYINKYKLS